MPEFRNPYHFLCWFFREMLKTFSKEPSFFCSKKVERFMIFLNANIALDICIHWLLVHDKITAEGSTLIYTVQMLYAGYQTKQIFNDKTKTVTSSDTDRNGSESSTSVTSENT